MPVNVYHAPGQVGLVGRAIALLTLSLLLGGCVQVDLGDDGARPSTTPTGLAAPAAPTLSFSLDPASPKAGQAVLFDLQATGLSAGDRLAGASWRFGDGST